MFQHFQYGRHPETAVSVACSSPYEEKGKEREDFFLSFPTLGGRRLLLLQQVDIKHHFILKEMRVATWRHQKPLKLFIHPTNDFCGPDSPNGKHLFSNFSLRTPPPPPNHSFFVRAGFSLGEGKAARRAIKKQPPRGGSSLNLSVLRYQIEKL